MNKLNIRRLPPLEYAASEAVNTLCTNLSFSGENVKRIMFTSCHAAEGKSFMAMNVMRSMARLGKRVVLVDADLRRSMISSRYGIRFETEKRGLAHYLAGMATENEIVYATNINGAYMVPVGRTVSNSLQLLVSPHFKELLNSLARKMDYVIVDAPPLGLLIDAAEIAKSCDGALIVVGYDSVHRQELLDVKAQLEQTGCPVLGAVLNGVQFDDYMNKKYYYKKSYNAYYSKAYGEEDKSSPRARSSADRPVKRK